MVIFSVVVGGNVVVVVVVVVDVDVDDDVVLAIVEATVAILAVVL